MMLSRIGTDEPLTELSPVDGTFARDDADSKSTSGLTVLILISHDTSDLLFLLKHNNY